MLMIKIIPIILILIVATHQSQYVPIPKTLVGILFGNPLGKITFELVYDPVCYDSRDFDVNIIRALQAELSKQILNQISFRIVGQAKPWHLTAHKIIQGINYILDKKGPELALTSFRYFLDNIPKWDNTPLQTNTTINQYMDALAVQFANITGVDKTQIRPQLNQGSDYDRKARYEFKHTIGNRFSGLNPTIFVNGAKIDNGKNISLDDWKKLINSLLTGNSVDLRIGEKLVTC